MGAARRPPLGSPASSVSHLERPNPPPNSFPGREGGVRSQTRHERPPPGRESGCVAAAGGAMGPPRGRWGRGVQGGVTGDAGGLGGLGGRGSPGATRCRGWSGARRAHRRGGGGRMLFSPAAGRSTQGVGELSMGGEEEPAGSLPRSRPWATLLAGGRREFSPCLTTGASPTGASSRSQARGADDGCSDARKPRRL